MKISFSTLGCPDWDIHQILNCAKECKYNAVELRGINGVTDISKIPELSDDRIADTAKAFADAGAPICVIGSSASFHDNAKSEQNLAEAMLCIDKASALGAKYVRVFGNNIPDISDEQQTIALVGNSIKTLCVYAQKKNVDILLEVHGDFNTAQRLLNVEKIVSESNFGIIWDVAHSDIGYKESFASFYYSVKHLVKHIHIKDHIRNTDGTLTLCDLGKGDIPLKDIISLLENDGYTGLFSLEWEKQWHPELRDASEVFYEFPLWILRKNDTKPQNHSQILRI